MKKEAAIRVDGKNGCWTIENCVVYESYKTSSPERGDTCYGVVGSTNRHAFPDLGYNEEDGYWYEIIE